jgi:hypothetical protein
MGVFTVRGPGDFVNIMDFVVTADPLPDGTCRVSLLIYDFLFQKGSLGMNPSINGKAAIGKFVTELQQALR